MAVLQVEYLEKLTPERRDHLLNRSKTDVSQVLEEVRAILTALQRDGDAESLRWHRQYKSDLTVSELEVTPAEIEAAYQSLDPKVLTALKVAAANIEAFHQAQRDREMWAVEVRPGITAGRLVRPIPRVGCYIPGGLASYPSSALMNVIPAKVAGVQEIIACTPPGEGMALNPATVVAAHLAGAHRLFKLGGPWAIGSLAYGTDTVPQVDKIVGPASRSGSSSSRQTSPRPSSWSSAKWTSTPPPAPARPSSWRTTPRRPGTWPRTSSPRWSTTRTQPPYWSPLPRPWPRRWWKLF